MRTVKVSSNAGSFIGEATEKSVQFRGIPYAEPPVGPLRFKAPQKLKTKLVEYSATDYPNRSAQDEWDPQHEFYQKEFYNDTIYKTPISEDSLYLNIWTPEIDVNKLKPVMLYIHGGAFVSGTGHEIEFRTEKYAERDIILVTINYRLGIFGFLAHPWLCEESQQSCGFYGILDQIAALEWIRENIAAFGGDPENITICGQSAGAMSVETLLATPLASEKFHKAIIQSGGGYPQYIMPNFELEYALEFGEKLLNKAGIKNLEELRNLSKDDLLQIQRTAFGLTENNQLPFGPVINGYALKDSISGSIAKGNIHSVPIMIGSTKDDITVSEEEKKTGTNRMLESNLNFSLKLEKALNNPCYVYYFTRDLPGDEAGAFHSGELWYMFGTLKNSWRPFEENDYRLSDAMLAYWSNFAATGDPNGEGLGSWDTCTVANPFIKNFCAQ